MAFHVHSLSTMTQLVQVNLSFMLARHAPHSRRTCIQITNSGLAYICLGGFVVAVMLSIMLYFVVLIYGLSSP